MRKCGPRIHPMLVPTSAEPEKRGVKHLILSDRSRGWIRGIFLVGGRHVEMEIYAPISGHQFPMTVSKQSPWLPSISHSITPFCNGCSDRDSASSYYREGHEGVVGRSKERKLEAPRRTWQDKCAKPAETAVCGAGYEARKILPLLHLYMILPYTRPTKPLHRRRKD